MSLANLPSLYLARMDVDPMFTRRFLDWYEDKHAPDLIAAGFYSTRGFFSRIGAPFVCNVYEIESSEIFYSDAYQNARTEASDPLRPEVLSHVSNRSNIVYRQRWTHGVLLPDRPWSAGSRDGAVDAEHIGVLRFDTDPAADDDLLRWTATCFEELAGRAGVLRIRLGEQHGRPHPARPALEPRWVVLVEFADPDSAFALGSEADVVGLLDSAPGSPTRGSYNVAQRVTSLMRPSHD